MLKFNLDRWRHCCGLIDCEILSLLSTFCKKQKMVDKSKTSTQQCLRLKRQFRQVGIRMCSRRKDILCHYRSSKENERKLQLTLLHKDSSVFQVQWEEWSGGILTFPSLIPLNKQNSGNDIFLLYKNCWFPGCWQSAMQCFWKTFDQENVLLSHVSIELQKSLESNSSASEP